MNKSIGNYENILQEMNLGGLALILHRKDLYKPFSFDEIDFTEDKLYLCDFSEMRIKRIHSEVYRDKVLPSIMISMDCYQKMFMYTMLSSSEKLQRVSLDLKLEFDKSVSVLRAVLWSINFMKDK